MASQGLPQQGLLAEQGNTAWVQIQRQRQFDAAVVSPSC